MPLLDWLAVNASLYFLPDILILIFGEEMKDKSARFPSRGISGLHWSKVSSVVIGFLRRINESLAVLLRKMSHVQSILQNLESVITLDAPLALTPEGSGATLASSNQKFMNALPRTTWWIQGSHFGKSPLELLSIIAQELEDNEAIERISITIVAHGKHWNGVIKGLHVYASNENPGQPETQLSVWLNHGGLYGDVRSHGQNLRRYLWCVIPTAQRQAPCDLPNGVDLQLQCSRDQPRIVGQVGGLTVVWKPKGWLCPGADMDLLKGEPLPLTASQLGLTSLSELALFSKQRSPPQLQWFMQIQRPDNAAYHDPRANYGLCSRLDIGTHGLLVIAETSDLRKQHQNAAQRGAISKFYLAMTGIPPPGGRLSSPNERDVTTVMGTRKGPLGKSVSLIHLVGGRGHQIRQDLAAAGTPILGDSIYGIRHVSDLQLACFQLGICLNGKRTVAVGAPSQEFMRLWAPSNVDLPKEGIRTIDDGLMLIGETRNQEELPDDFSDLG